MTVGPSLAPPCTSDHCITCGDDGVAMTVLELDDDRGLALCQDAGGEHHTVEVALVAPIAAGDELLVHAGVALVRLDAVAVRA